MSLSYYCCIKFEQIFHTGKHNLKDRITNALCYMCTMSSGKVFLGQLITCSSPWSRVTMRHECGHQTTGHVLSSFNTIIINQLALKHACASFLVPSFAPSNSNICLSFLMMY